MDSPIKYQEDDYGIIYSYLDSYISVPNGIQNNIKLCLSFEKNQTDLVNSMNKYRTEGNILFLTITNNIPEVDYIYELSRIKRLVNQVYNLVLKEKNLSRDKFIRKIEILNNGNNKEFVNWLCVHYSNKFYKSGMQVDNVFKNNDVIFNTPKTDTVNNVPVVNSSYTPTDEKLSIGEINPVYKTLPNPNTQVNNGGFYRSSNNNAAFIKLPMIILVLLLSTIIGVGISIFMLK
ncbi:MAG: hypothetical protein MR550_01975 [Bacilli bacterium]|nr:hypothetical protein [Bacilli bacterium]